MYELKLNPRFADTDALGHINNASYSKWFEDARRPIFKLFVPDLDPKKWNLILARMEIDFLAQGHYQQEVLIQTSLVKIGNSSFTLLQEAYQNQVKICSSKAYLVHFNYGTQKSTPIPESIRSELNLHIN